MSNCVFVDFSICSHVLHTVVAIIPKLRQTYSAMSYDLYIKHISKTWLSKASTPHILKSGILTPKNANTLDKFETKVRPPALAPPGRRAPPRC